MTFFLNAAAVDNAWDGQALCGFFTYWRCRACDVICVLCRFARENFPFAASDFVMVSS